MITLTKHQILALQAGPELDALIAQEFFNLKVVATDFPLRKDPDNYEWIAESQVVPDGNGGWVPAWQDPDEETKRGAVYVYQDAMWPPERDEKYCTETTHYFYGDKVRDYSTDIAAAFWLEENIEGRGMKKQYTRYMLNFVEEPDMNLDLWQLVHASPEMRCKAALLAQLQRQEALREITRIGEEMGQYD